jgi:hypothetical protein
LNAFKEDKNSLKYASEKLILYFNKNWIFNLLN